MQLTESAQRRLFWITAIVMIAVMALLRLHTIHEPFDRDITGLAYIAHQLIEGKAIYVGVWDHKPPLAPYIFALFELVFGYNDVSIYMINIVFFALILISVGLVTRELIGSLPAIFVMVIYGLVSQSTDLQSNQPYFEVMVNAFKLLGIYLFLRSMRIRDKRSWYLLIISGLIIGASSAVKLLSFFTYVSLLSIIFIYRREGIYDFQKRIKQAIAFSISAAFIWIAIIAEILIVGSFDAFWDAVIVYNSEVAKGFWDGIGLYLIDPRPLFPPFLKWEAFITIFAYAFIGTFAIREKRFEKLILLILIFAAFIEVGLPGQYYPHYYQLLIPFVVIAAVWTIVTLVKSFEGRKAIIVSILLVGIAIVPLVVRNIQCLAMTPEHISFKKNPPDISNWGKKAGVYMKDNFRHGLSLYDWGAETGLYYYSKMDSNVPYFYYYPLLFGKPKTRTERMKKFISIVTNDPPDIFVDLDDPKLHHQLRSDIDEIMGIEKYLNELYTLHTQVGPFSIYCHNRFVVGEGDDARCDIERKN